MKARLLCLLLLSAFAGCSTCAKLDAAKKPFPCIAAEFDGGQCPDGWRCGLAGKCFDPAVGEELACTDAARHCAGGWNCGRGVDGGPGLCHPAGVGDAYRCAVETEAQDCEDPAWRCDPVTATCVNVSEDLQPSIITTSQVEQLSPRFDTGRPSHVAVGRLEAMNDPRTGNPVKLRTLAYLTDAGLTSVMLTEEPVFLGDGGLAWTLVRRFPLDEAQVVSVAAFDTRVAVVLAGGAVRLYDAFTGSTSDGGVGVSRVVPVDPSPGASSLTPASARALAFGPGWLQMLFADGGAALFPRPDGGFGELRDVTGAESQFVAIDADRVYRLDQGRIDGGDQVLEIAAVDAGVVRRLHGIMSDSFSPFLVAEVDGPAGQPAWGLLQRDNSGTFVLRRGPCPVCPSGAAPLHVSVTDDDPGQAGDESIVARCPATGGGLAPVQRTWRVKPGIPGGCEPTAVGQEPTSFSGVDDDEEPFAFDVTPMRATSTYRAFGAAQGHVWWAEDFPGSKKTNPTTPLHPLLLDRTPMLVTRFAQQAGQQRVTRIYATTGGQHFNLSELGLTSELGPVDPLKFSFVGTTQGRPGILIGNNQVLNLNAFSFGSGEPQVLAQLDPNLPVLTAPAVGAIVSVGSPARSLLVVTSRDTLYSADVTDQLQVRQADGGGVDGAAYPPATLTQRLVPAPGVPIRDVAVGRRVRVEPGAETPLGTLFVLARDEVFEVDIFGTRWTTTPIPLSPEFGEPLELWTEYVNHGRLAYASGQISALPVPIALGQKLPAGERATDFARMCGETFAIVDSGVKHYRTDAGWEDVPGIALAAGERAGSRFFETGVSLFLGTPRGRVLELSKMKNAAGLPVCQ